jgi:dihydroxy-acid dehydratase
VKKPKSNLVFDDKDFPISLVRRCVLQGTGIDIEEGKQKPIIAIANSQTEINPGHMHLDTIAQRVKEGVHAAGGIPFEFSVPAPCDGITEGHEGMRFVLAQRKDPGLLIRESWVRIPPGPPGALGLILLLC